MYEQHEETRNLFAIRGDLPVRAWSTQSARKHTGYFADNFSTGDFLRKNLKENVDLNQSFNSPSDSLST